MKRTTTWLFSMLVTTVLMLTAQNSQAWLIEGVVWYDNDCDGIRGGGEPGVGGVTVEVHNCSDNALVATTVTEPNGSYDFSDVPPFPIVPTGGTYRVCFTNIPSGYSFTTQTYPPPAAPTVVSTVDPTSGCAPCFTFTNMFDNTLNNAGICQGTTPENPGTGTPGYWKNHPEKS